MAVHILRKNSLLLFPANKSLIQKNYVSMIREIHHDSKVTNDAQSNQESLESKEYLRPLKAFSASDNVSDKVCDMCKSLQNPNDYNHRLSNMEEKFKLLASSFKNFQHSVPNSLLHKIKTVGDVIGFYETSVSTTTPYEKLAKMELPKNLHIQKDSVRFQDESNIDATKQTAFPKSSTLVTGLKYRGKYEGHIAKRSWP